MCDIRVCIAPGGGGCSENVYRELQCTLLVRLQCGGGMVRFEQHHCVDLHKGKSEAETAALGKNKIL